MKKLGLVVFIVFIFSVLVGYFFGKYYPLMIGNAKQSTTVIDNASGKTKTVGTSDEIVLSTASLEEKLLPTANLILEKRYQDCKHTVVTESELPVEMANLTEDEIKQRYPAWIVKDFSKDSVTLYKLEDGLCGEHFVINEEDGNVVVYRLDEDYNKTLYEKTDIYTEYLPQEDVLRLKEGIYVYSTANLNSELENLE